MVVEKPRLLFKTETSRKPYVRRFMWMLLGTVAAAGAWIAMEEAIARGESVGPLVDIGRVLAAVVTGLLFIRMMMNLYQAISTKKETIHVFNRGFSWERKGEQHKYTWMQLRSFREGAQTRRLFGRRIFTSGAHVLTMRDGAVYKFTARHGDTDRFARAIRSQVTEVTGSALSRALRSKKSVKLHPRLTVAAGGLSIGKQKIPWSRVDIKKKNNNLDILKLEKGGKFKKVRRFKVHKMENVSGFLDLADSLIRNHQPDRFNIKVKGV